MPFGSLLHQFDPMRLDLGFLLFGHRNFHIVVLILGLQMKSLQTRYFEKTSTVYEQIVLPKKSHEIYRHHQF